MTVTAGTAVLNGADIKNVEILNVRNVGGGAAAVDASQVVGLTEVNSDRSTGSLTVTNLATGATLGLKGNGVAALGDVTGSYVAAATAANIVVDGGTGAASSAVTVLDGAALTSATITSKGGVNALNGVAFGTDAGTADNVKTVTIDAQSNLTTGNITGLAAGSTITVKGAGTANIGTLLATNVTSVDASANTGGVTAVLNNVATLKVVGGSGNDVLTTGAVLTTGSVDGGAGRDTLVLADVNHANTAALAAKYTNFEVLRVNGTFDASLIAGIEAIELSDTINNISKLNATQAANVTALADIDTTTLALSDATGTADVVSVTFGDGKGAAFDADALTINGFETLNVKANAKADNADQTTEIASFVADKLTQVNLTGSAVTLANAATTLAVAIDGSALTGTGGATPTGLTISGDLVAGSTVTGSATVANTFNLGTAGSSYTGGAGKDAFNVTAVTQLRDGATYNKIDGGAGEDTLTVTANAISLVDDDFKEIKNIEKIVLDADDGAGDVNVTTGGWYDGNFKAGGMDLTVFAADDAVSFTGGTFSGNQKLTVTTTTLTKDTAILTGSGNDTVKVAANDLTTGDITVSTGAGDDSIEIDVSAALDADAVIAINGGAGKDTIKLVDLDAADAQYVTVTVGAGQSTLAAYDSITGFSFGGGASSVILDFAGTAVAATNQAAASVVGFTAAELTFTINGGLLTFAGTSAAGLTLEQKIGLVDSLVTANLSTVVFTHGGNSYVYNENTAGDSLVELVGVEAAGIGTGATLINIA